MATQGPNSPGTLANADRSGGIAWASPSNAASSNDSHTTHTTDGVNNASDYLVATNFGFSIPSGATIDGFLVEVEGKKSSGAFIGADLFYLTKDGSTDAGENMVGSYGSGTWTTTDAYMSWGDATYLAATSWTYSEVNASTFGVMLSVSNSGDSGDIASVDHIRITIHYTEVVAPQLSTSDLRRNHLRPAIFAPGIAR